MKARIFLFLLFGFFLIAPFVNGKEKSRKVVSMAGATPFLKKHCYACHGKKKQKDDLNLETLSQKLDTQANVDIWKAVMRQIVLGQMPPEKKPRPSYSDVTKVTQTIDDALVSAGQDPILYSMITHPDFGNYVSHEDLFSGKYKGPAWSPSRVWRKNSYNSLSSLTLPVRDGIRDYAVEGQIDVPTLESLMALAGGAITRQVYGYRHIRQPKKTSPPIRIYAAYCNASSSNSALGKAVIVQGFKDGLGRTPTKEELSKYLAVLEAHAATGDKKLAIKMTVMEIHLSPEALFRMEIGLGKKGSAGRTRLSTQEIRFALIFALSDSFGKGADPSGRSYAGHGKAINAILNNADLNTEEGVKAAVQEMLSTKQVGKPRKLRFFTEFFNYADTATLFKDFVTAYEQRQKMMRDANVFLKKILESDKDVFEQMLTSSKYPLTAAIGRHNKYLLKSYNISKEELKVIEVKAKAGKANKTGYIHDFKGQRAGMLTHPTWLFSKASNNETHPVQRGKWILERLLAGTMPPIPVTVEANLPEDEHKTLRERFDVVKDEYCWSCHKKMNPLGMTFEHYDFVGNLRSKDANKDVDASMDLTEIKGLEGVKVDNIIGLMNVLVKKPRVRQSIIRHAFRFWMGRNETLDDSPTLMAADKAYVESGGSFNAVLVSLLSSDSFLYRK